METKKTSVSSLKVEGWVNLLRGTLKYTVNTHTFHAVLMDERKAGYMLFDLQIYGAFLSLPNITRFWVLGDLTYGQGWYVNLRDMQLLDTEANLTSIRPYCPEGFIESLKIGDF